MDDLVLKTRSNDVLITLCCWKQNTVNFGLISCQKLGEFHVTCYLISWALDGETTSNLSRIHNMDVLHG